jgi:hypothetical protein
MLSFIQVNRIKLWVNNRIHLGMNPEAIGSNLLKQVQEKNKHFFRLFYGLLLKHLSELPPTIDRSTGPNSGIN